MSHCPALPRRSFAAFLASRRAPLIYVNMPKSACTSLKNILYWLDHENFLDDPLTIHRRTDLLVRGATSPAVIANRLSNDVVFTFVRHPLQRAFSCFNEKIFSQGPYSFPRVRQYLCDAYQARFMSQPSLDNYRDNFKSFLRFSHDSFRGKNGWRRDPHWCPQTMVLANVERVRRVDFIGRVESFNAHLSVLLSISEIPMPPTLPAMNEGAVPPFKFKEVVDDEVEHIAMSFLDFDMHFFGYSNVLVE